MRLTALVSGRVQGVGFRYWARDQAADLGLCGSATNLRDGRVEVIAEGTRAACGDLLERLRGPSAPGTVLGIEPRWEEPRGASGFRVG